jgi:hypothetical protein
MDDEDDHWKQYFLFIGMWLVSPFLAIFEFMSWVSFWFAMCIKVDIKDEFEEIRDYSDDATGMMVFVLMSGMIPVYMILLPIALFVIFPIMFVWKIIEFLVFAFGGCCARCCDCMRMG